MSNQKFIFLALLSVRRATARLRARQRRIADLDTATDAKAAVCSNGYRIRFDGVLELDDFLRT